MEREYIVKYVNETNGIFTKSDPLIRCKDCKYWDKSDSGWFCPYHHDAKPDWYCADGKPKDGDNV